MEHRFESHGLLFIVESDGFVRNDARDDFEEICERIEKTLNDMPAAEAARMHTAASVTMDGPEAHELGNIGDRIKAEVLREWHNPNGVAINLIALPAGA
jgi:hypothetical protein